MVSRQNNNSRNTFIHTLYIKHVTADYLYARKNEHADVADSFPKSLTSLGKKSIQNVTLLL